VVGKRCNKNLLVDKGQFTPWTMKWEHGRWPFSMVRLDGPPSMVWFLWNKSIYKAFGPLTRHKLNVDQEEWPCTRRWMCWIFFIWVQKGQFWKDSSLTILLSFLVFIFSSAIFFYYNVISLPWALAFPTRAPLLPLPPQKKMVGPCQVSDVGLKKDVSWGPQPLRSLWHIFPLPWCKRKRSYDKFNIQSQFHKASGRLHVPRLKQPLQFTVVSC
jgi:hypothetical protein